MKEFFKTILYTPLYNILIFLIWLMPGNSLGGAIIVLTILIRIILLPSSLKAAKAQVKLQALQPKINKLRKEIKDQKEQSQAMMELYKKEGASPFGSCLPLLIQLPIIFILYRVFIIGVGSIHPDLLYSFTPRPEVINTIFLGIDLSKPNLWLLPIIAGATQFVLTRLTTPPQPKENSDKDKDPMQMATKQMMFIFPLFTILIARSLPAALALYWIVTTLFGIVQQIYVNKTIKKEEKFKEEVEEDKKEIEEEIKEYKTEHKKDKKNEKKDMMTKLANRRLEKQAKKTGVEVTVRKKK